jgi:Zn-dependent protease with chaperone function
MSQGILSRDSVEPVSVERWPTELPLLAFVTVAAAAIWILLFVSIIGFMYGLFIGAFFFLSHLGFVAHVRGSAVRLSPEQFPDLHARVEELAARAGLKRVPETYIMQAGGALNALATKFLRSHMLVLFSDLLEACGDNTAARDMIVGHELGHLKAGHLRWRWFLLPGFFVPFLGMAYSRAREYTCDRYGAALCGDRDAALVGLGILAAGGSHGHRVNIAALARQREHLDTGWMTIGTWLGTHPPLAHRIVALQPALSAGAPPLVKGPLRAIGILASVGVIAVFGAAFGVKKFLPVIQQALRQAQPRPPEGVTPVPAEQVEAATRTANDDLRRLADVVKQYVNDTGKLPEDADHLYDLWERAHPDEPELVDPFDGLLYGYVVKSGRYQLWSTGPDAVSGTEDDIFY